MKKIVVIALVMGVFAFASCKKEYSCSCTFDNGLGSDTTIVYDYGKQNKSDAEDACNSQDATIKVVDSDGSCTLL